LYIGEYRIDDYVTLIATTHRFSSGAAYAPSAITYRVYEDATDVEIVADTAMTNFDTETGFYLDRIQCTAVLGYEVGKTYTALIKATVDSVAAITAYTWRILTPPVNVAQWLGTACATPTVNGVPEVDLTHVAGVTTNVSTLATNVDAILTDTADMQPKLGTPAGASISADILVIDNFVDGLETTIGIAGAGLMDLGGMSTTMKAQVQTECDDALVSMNLDHLVGTATAIPAIVAGTYIDQMVDDGTAVYDRTTDSLQAIRDHATTIKTDTAAILTDTGTDGVALANGAISSTKFAAGGIDAAAVAADVGYEFADALLNRNVAGGSNTGRLVKEALYLLRNRSAISSGTLTVYQTDDATSQWTAAVTTAVGNPVSGVDPA